MISLFIKVALSLLLSCILMAGAFSQNSTKEKLIFSDDFTSPLDSALWITEIASLPASKVFEGQLILDTKGGVTVWLNKKFSRNSRIEYARKVLIDSGQNDQLSDVNEGSMGIAVKVNLFLATG